MSLQNAAADAQPSSSRGRSNADEAASKTSKKSQETHALGVTARSNSTAPSSALSGVPANAHASGPLLPPSGPLLPSDTNHSINFSSSTSSARHLLHGNSRQPANFSSAVKKTPSASRQGVVDHPTTPVKIKVENQHLLELKVQAEADYAHLSHFRALLERSELHHSPNSAATVPLNDGGEPVSGDDDTPHNTHALLLDQFMKTLEMRAEAAQARFESALSRERRKPTAKPVFHAISRSDHVNGPLDEYFRSIRREERQAFRSSDRIQYERPSQDDSDHVRDQNGYVQDGFVVDDDLASSMASSAESSDGSLYCDSEAQSIDAAQISRQCLEAVAECYPKRRPAFPLSCEDAKRSTLEGPVSFKTPGRRVVEMELLLSAWVRQRDLDSISHKQLALFFEILHVNEAEFVRSVFKHFIRRFQHLSWKFCSFLWKTVKCCCPQFAPIFSNSWEVYCEDKKHKPSSTRPEQHSKYQDQSDRRAAPRTRRPEIKALEDIKQFMSVFLVDYGKYRRDHENAKFGYDSLFQCLTPAQQKTLSSITSTPIDTCMAMSTEDTCELVRFAYGKKSMASALVLLKATRFSGDALTPADWSRFFQLFSETVQEIHHLAMPPDDKIAKIFLRACPSAFMRNTLLLNKHTTLDEAFAQVNALLHDPAFLRDAHKAAQSDRHDRDHSDAHVRQHRDRHAQRSSPQPHAYAQQQQPAHARPSPPIHGQPPALLPPAPLRRGPACSRCRRDGCDPSMCIRRRDKDGNELPRLEPDEYRRRKDLQRARDPAAAPAVAAIMTDDTDESSSSAFFTTSDSESDHDGYCAAVMDSPEVSPSSLRFLFGDSGGAAAIQTHDSRDEFCVHRAVLEASNFCCAIFGPAQDWELVSDTFEDVVDIVPAPPLDLSGDVEKNPGPKRQRPMPLLLPTKRKWELAACVLAATTMPTHAHVLPTSTVLPSVLPSSSSAVLLPHFLVSSAFFLAMFCMVATLAWRCAAARRAIVSACTDKAPTPMFQLFNIALTAIVASAYAVTSITQSPLLLGVLCAFTEIFTHCYNALPPNFVSSVSLLRPPALPPFVAQAVLFLSLFSACYTFTRAVKSPVLLGLLCALAELLLRCGDVEANPGPPSIFGHSHAPIPALLSAHSDGENGFKISQPRFRIRVPLQLLFRLDGPPQRSHRSCLQVTVQISMQTLPYKQPRFDFNPG